MTVLRKIAAVIVMVLAALGFLACVVGLIGVWATNTPVTNAATGVFGAVQDNLGVASNAVSTTSQFVGDIQSDVDRVNQAATDLKDKQRAVAATLLSKTIGDELPAKVARVRSTAGAISDTVVRFNDTLVSFNRIPGVAVPTLSDALQGVEQRIGTMQANVNDVKTAVDNALPDGARIIALTAAISSRLQEIQTRLGLAKTRIDSVVASVGAIKDRVPFWIDMGSVAASLWFILFGAGQFFLFRAARNWFKGPARAAT
jgi:hypothetical protein